jgi:uncharacterized protein (DUF1697 family)
MSADHRPDPARGRNARGCETAAVTVIVALLRGVNVGGRGKLAMTDLREVAAAAGIGDARTYIQSGNLVGTTPSRSTDAVARSLAEAIAGLGGVAPDVAVRTRAELAKVIEHSPFLRRGEDPGLLHVAFMVGRGKAKVELADLDRYSPDEIVAVDRELHLFTPNGLGRSKLAADLLRPKLARGTMRNWRTVTKLLEMADELG